MWKDFISKANRWKSDSYVFYSNKFSINYVCFLWFHDLYVINVFKFFFLILYYNNNSNHLFNTTWFYKVEQITTKKIHVKKLSYLKF